MQQHHVPMLGMGLVEPVPDQGDVVKIEPTGERDLGSRWQQRLGVRAAFGGQEIAAVDHRRGERAMIDE